MIKVAINIKYHTDKGTPQLNKKEELLKKYLKPNMWKIFCLDPLVKLFDVQLALLPLVSAAR